MLGCSNNTAAAHRDVEYPAVFWIVAPVAYACVSYVVCALHAYAQTNLFLLITSASFVCYRCPSQPYRSHCSIAADMQGQQGVAGRLYFELAYLITLHYVFVM